MHRPSLAALLVALAACGRSPAPVTAPAPARAPAPVAASRRPSADTTRRADTAVVSSAEVLRRAIAVFGDSIVVDSTADDGPTWDIDVRSYETHERVAHYVQLFSGVAREHTVEQIERGTRYEPMIRAKLRAGGLPEDLSYLALVESGYYPHAYSRSAAVGMWQLMTTTARDGGLRVDWWVDERRDPVRATNAAISFLRYLRGEFGSLYLAAAAYNGGPGRVSRGLTRFADDLSGSSGDDVFFALADKDYLRKETKEYVPQLIAAALVAKNPAHYGMVIHAQPPYAYDSVRVPSETPVSAVARAAGATIADETDLNPELLRGMTPPGAARWVRVPVGRAAGFDAAFAALSPAERTAVRRVEAEPRQTFASLAEDAGISSRQLSWYNPAVRLTRKGYVAEGQTVLVPSRDCLAAARDVPDPSIERYSARPVASKSTTHVVKRGETLERLARRYDVSVASVKRLNHLRGGSIKPGQTLVMKRSSAREVAAAARAARRGATTGSSRASRASARGGAAKAKASTARARAAANSAEARAASRTGGSRASTGRATSAGKKVKSSGGAKKKRGGR